MFHKLAFSFGCLTCLTSASAAAEDWADRLFAERNHNFGTVARAAKAEHVFELKNPYDFPLHIASVRASCGCTTPTVTRHTIQPGETGAVVAKLNSRTFTGNRSATITVTFDRPRFAQTRLKIWAFIRKDIVVDPGVVQFGQLAPNERGVKRVNVDYAGRSDWRILGVKSSSEHVSVELRESFRSRGRVSYQIDVNLAENAPAGYLQEELVLATSDRSARSQRIPLKVEGRIMPRLSIAPSDLDLGRLQVGEEVSRRLIVRGYEPFRIVQLAGDDNAQLVVQGDDETKPLHVLTVTFRPQSAGRFEQKVLIQTDLPGAQTASFRAVADVQGAGR